MVSVRPTFDEAFRVRPCRPFLPTAASPHSLIGSNVLGCGNAEYLDRSAFEKLSWVDNAPQLPGGLPTIRESVFPCLTHPSTFLLIHFLTHLSREVARPLGTFIQLQYQSF